MTVRLQELTVQSGLRRLRLISPPHPRLRQRARALGGQYVDATDAWYFAPEQFPAVVALCRELYGQEPVEALPPADRVTAIKDRIMGLASAERRTLRDWLNAQEDRP
jgi:hypothetical protein